VNQTHQHGFIANRWTLFKQPITNAEIGVFMDSNSLLSRLDEIGKSLERSSHALALIGLGSVGVELEQLDAYSDLDFFVIVEPGYKSFYLNDLAWISAINGIAYHFSNTQDGYKLLFEDGIFSEFAVFEPDELQTIPLSGARIVWKQPQAADTLIQPTKTITNHQKHSQAWLLGEALTNLYVGMNREKRGEHLSAMRFIQGYAVDRLLELVEAIQYPQPVPEDEFALERRFEQRFPGGASRTPGWLQGYTRNRESALEILAFLQQNFEINNAMAEAIHRLCK
jgi:lincosamide nucleotidyltransferase B/F